jgi:DNA modification methylase
MKQTNKLPKTGIKEQVITDKYALYCSDCMYVLPTLPDESVDLSVYSPPFCGLYQYTSHENDFSNCETKEAFLRQYDFLIAEISRVTKPGCITAVHCTDIINNSTGALWDFPHEIKVLHEKYGFVHRNTVTIWKEPLKVRMRTMVQSLMHKFIVEDASECFTAMPDYLLIFKKKGERAVPVEHPIGLTHYAGEIPLLPAHLNTYGLPMEDFDFRGNFGDAFYAYSQASYKALQKKYAGHEDPKTNKLSHLTWQRYASSTWDDVRIDNVLPFRDAKDEDDERHVHPLQLDVIDRIIDLYSSPGEVVFTPFMGVGSEVFSPVSMGRFGIGVELKDSYFKQAILNTKEAEKRFNESRPAELFDMVMFVDDTENQ